MKTIVMAMSAMILFGAINQPEASAAGLGVFASYAGASRDWTSRSLARTLEHGYGAGIVIDTCVARDEVYNFRFTAGADRISASTGSRSYLWSEYDGLFDARIRFLEKPVNGERYRLQFINAFGLIRSRSFRLWTGIQMDLGYDRIHLRYSEYEYFTNHVVPTTPYLQYRPDRKKNIGMIGAGAGLVLGINLHVSDAMSLTLQGSGSILYAIGKNDSPMYTYNSSLSKFRSMEWSVKTGVLYRFGDSF